MRCAGRRGRVLLHVQLRAKNDGSHQQKNQHKTLFSAGLGLRTLVLWHSTQWVLGQAVWRGHSCTRKSRASLSARALASCSLKTGSNPPFTNGLHLSSRHVAIKVPRIAPWRSSASAAYSEQVGT